MPVKITVTQNTFTAYLSGEIDHHSAKSIREEIDEAVTRMTPEEVYLDFKDVVFMDSSGIGLVMGRYSLIQELGGQLRLRNMSSHIRKVMRLAGLDRLVLIENGGVRI